MTLTGKTAKSNGIGKKLKSASSTNDRLQCLKQNGFIEV